MANLKDLLVNGSTNHVGRNYSQTPALGTKDRQVATTEFVLDNCYKPPLLSCMWADHVVNDTQWLRADTFSWQSGTVYTTVYNLLKTEVENLTKTTLYSATGTDSSVVYVSKSTGLAVGDVVYSGTANSTIHKVGTISAISDSGFTYNNIVYTVETATVSTNIFDVEGGIYYLTTANGFKIADATQEQAILNLYNTTGVAWFYILDTTNQRFKLPRTKYGFVGLRDSVGGYVPESLPNIKGSWTGAECNTVPRQGTGAITWVDAGGGYGGNKGGARGSGFDFNASAYDSTYQDNAPVQERATQMYLYFYVGEFARNSVQQTAGINSELFNGKVDLNFNNMNPGQTAKDTIVGWGIPDYSAGVSLTTGTFTALNDGCIVATLSSLNNNYKIQLTDSEGEVLIAGKTVGAYADDNSGTLLVKKGQTYYVTNIGAKITYYPMSGEE